MRVTGPEVLRQPVPLILVAVSLVLRRGRSRRPLSFSPSQNGLSLVETLRGLAALSVYGCCVKPTCAALSLHVLR